MDENSEFDFGDFKKWVKRFEESSSTKFNKSKSPLIGKRVKSRIKTSKLVEAIEPEEGEIDDLILDFKESGGLISDINGEHFLIQVESGNFYIPRKYTKKVI